MKTYFKNHYLRVLSTLVAAFLCPYLSAQDTDPSLSTQLRDGYFSPASPEAASMVRYGGDAGPDLRTGTVGFSIPVYTYSDHDFELPVTLCYASSGYQPGSDPGAIGNGWYLSCGGCITREVRGLPDESRGCKCFPKNDDGLTAESISHILQMNGVSYWQIRRAVHEYNESIRPTVEGYARRHLGLAELCDTVDFAYTNELGSEFLMCSRIEDYGYYNTFVEMEPDIYHYSFLGHTGSFILQPEGRVLIMETDSPSGNVEVTYHWSESLPLDNTWFSISLGDGYRYDFDCREEVHSFNDADGEDNGNRSIGSWKLSRITAPNGRQVTFSYLPNQQVSQKSFLTGINIDHTTMNAQGSNPVRLWLEPGYPSEQMTVTNTVRPCLPQTVSVSGGSTISFTYDADGARRFLKKIEVRNSLNDVVRSCTLSSTGVTGTQVRFLKSVTIAGQGVWTMDYVGENYQYYGHANAMAWKTDWAGYYNGSSFENIVSGAGSSTMPQKAAALKAARQPSLSDASLTMLSKITWPTGGNTRFSYGLNSYKYVCSLPGMNPEPVTESVTYGLRLSAMDSYDRNGSQLQHIAYTYDKGELLRKPMIYFNYSIGSANLNFSREVVNTMSNIGYGKDSHVVYGKVVERISRTASSPAAETATTEYEYYGAGEGEATVSVGNGCTLPWNFVDWNFGFTDNGTEWDTFRNWTGCAYSGKLKSVTGYRGSSSGPVILSRKTNTCDSYVQKWVAADAALHNRTPYVEWPSVWMCSASHCIIVQPVSAYVSCSTKESFDTGGSLLSSIPVTVTVDSLGRVTCRQTTDSRNQALRTEYAYVGQTPFVESVTTRRNGLLASRTGYTYTQRSGAAGLPYYRPLSITRTATSAGEAGQVRTVVTFSQFDSYDNVTRSVDALGYKTEYTWDSGGQYLTSLKRYPAGNSGTARSTSWTWIPLVGASSVTTPGGRTVRYSYDSYGRLERIRDTQNNTLSQYYYHITNAQNDCSWTKTRTWRTANVYADDVMYYNGLGYPVQSRNVKYTPGYDLGTPYTYDALMRETRKWLPMPFEDLDESESEWAAFFIPTENDVLTYYQDMYGNEPDPDNPVPVPVRPYHDLTYEFSPSGRPLVTSLPGERYYLHPTTFDYLCSTIDGRQVTGVETTDGDGRVSTEWRDNEARVVALDREAGNSTARTLYRYDWRGNLTQVLTPAGNSYSYTYDNLSRPVSKTIPGRQYETFTYDDLDRVTSSQDGNQRANGVTVYYTYDNTGKLTFKKARKNGVYRTMEEYTYGTATGLKTSEKFYKLSADGWVSGTDYLNRSYTYDSEERISRVVETDSPQSYSLTTDYEYDIQGNVTRTVETCVKGGVTLAVTTECAYDSRGRKTSETVKVGNSTVSSVSLSYDDLGRLNSKNYGTGSDRISEFIGYDIHGWPSSRSSSLLSQSYAYEDSSAPGWTGNITRLDWRHLASTAEGTSYPSRAETLTYDALGRLSGSAMSTGGQSSGNSWSERNISYDLDGNLLHLDRYQASSGTPEASLGFTVSGNRRTGWGYDANGNVTLDPLRNFEIRYNLLNLASEVRIPAAGNTPATDLSSAVFYADGTRVGVIDPGTGGWISRYIGSLIYSGSNGSEVLDGIQTEDGFIDCSGGVSNAQMQYFLRDHLGSVRVVASDRNTVLSRTDYLPFGSRMTGNGLPESATARSAWFGFSGKENEKWDAASGTQHWLRGERWQHFGARAYDPATCIWTGIDPLAEKYPGVSPYAYCAGNPVNLVDPDGNIWETVLDIASLVTGVHSFVSNVKEGNVGGAVVDGIGVVADAAAVLLPVVPGVAGYSIKAARGIDKGADALKVADKVVDGAKAVDKAGDVAKGTENGVSVIKGHVHGNSASSTKAQHAYDIIDSDTGNVVKTGVSGGPIRRDGKSIRAENQVRKWNQEAGYEKYRSTITHEEPAGEGSRRKILDYEKVRAEQVRSQLNPNLHRRP